MPLAEISMSPLAENSRTKVSRARQHLNELDKLIIQYIKREPVSTYVETNLDKTSSIVWVRISEKLPPELEAIVGDVIHNLRSSLDGIAVAMVKKNGALSKAALRKTHFPIASDHISFEKQLNDKFSNASSRAKLLMKRLRPYRGGATVLWQIHQLDIADKHHGLIPAIVAQAYNIVKFSGMSLYVPGEKIPDDYEPPVFQVRFDLNVSKPLKNNDILAGAPQPLGTSIIDEYGVQIDGPPQNMPHCHYNFHVAFGETDIVGSEPIIPTLRRFIDFTERVIDIFDKRVLSKP